MTTDISTIDQQLETCAVEINRHGKELAHRILELGKWCAMARDLLAERRDGSFAAWVEAHCDVSLGYCYGAIRCYEAFGDCNGCKIDVRAMLLLSAKGVSDEVREAAIELAESGEQVTTAKVRELVDEHRVEPVRESFADADDESDDDESDEVLTGEVLATEETTSAETAAASPQAMTGSGGPKVPPNEIGERRYRIRAFVEAETDDQPAHVRMNVADLLEDLAAELRA